MIVTIDPIKSLEVAKEKKRDEIRAAFAVEADALIPDPIGGQHVWQGGYDKAARLYNARELSIEAGLTAVTYYDAANVGHELSLADAKTVAMTIGAKFQQDLARKQARMVAIDNAATIAEVEAIVW